MFNHIKFATVSDSRPIADVFDLLPADVPVHCCDAWLIQTKQTNKTYNGGLIFYYEKDEDTVLHVFERSRPCKLWQPSENNDKSCIHVTWEKDVSVDKNQLNRQIVEGVIQQVFDVLLTEGKTSFSHNDLDKHSFISFKRGRGYVPAIISALRCHPLLKDCRFNFANVRKHSNPNITRLTTEDLISHGQFKSIPRKIMTRSIKSKED